MPEIKRGNFSLNLGFLQVQAEVSEEDRQCAWELYTEICTRLSLIGKRNDPKCKDFSGELLIESLNSVYDFFKEARGIMRKFPVGQLKRSKTKHLGVLINDLMIHVLRPFLEKWQADFRYCYTQYTNKNKGLSPFGRQKKNPKYKEFLEDWRNIRLLMCDLQLELVKAYNLVNVNDVKIFYLSRKVNIIFNFSTTSFKTATRRLCLLPRSGKI